MPQHWIGRVFFARGVSLGQKWWPSLLGREISYSQWEGPSMHSRCLFFFLLCLGGGFLFHLSELPNVFALCSPISQIFPLSPYHLTFIPYAFENGVLLSAILVGQRGGTIFFKIELSVLGSLHSFIFFEGWANQIGTSSQKKLKKRTLEAPHLINRRGE